MRFVFNATTRLLYHWERDPVLILKEEGGRDSWPVLTAKKIQEPQEVTNPVSPSA
jgi:hypothetical protein